MRCSRGSHYYVLCTSFHLRQWLRNLIAAWSLDPSLKACLIVWSILSSILITWLLVVNGWICEHKWSATPIFCTCIVCGVRGQNVCKITVTDGSTGNISGLYWGLNPHSHISSMHLYMYASPIARFFLRKTSQDLTGDWTHTLTSLGGMSYKI